MTSTTKAITATVLYGDEDIPVLSRSWKRTTERMPYRQTELLKPGQHWRDAREVTGACEHYVQEPFEIFPAAAMAALELQDKGASMAIWTASFSHQCVLMSTSLVCIDITETGALGEILTAIQQANGGSLKGIPNAIALFPDGQIEMRKTSVTAKPAINANQHEFVRRARHVLGDRLHLAVLHWGGESAV